MQLPPTPGQWPAGEPEQVRAVRDAFDTAFSLLDQLADDVADVSDATQVGIVDVVMAARTRLQAAPDRFVEEIINRHIPTRYGTTRLIDWLRNRYQLSGHDAYVIYHHATAKGTHPTRTGTSGNPGDPDVGDTGDQPDDLFSTADGSDADDTDTEPDTDAGESTSADNVSDADAVTPRTPVKARAGTPTSAVARTNPTTSRTPSPSRSQKPSTSRKQTQSRTMSRRRGGCRRCGHRVRGRR